MGPTGVVPGSQYLMKRTETANELEFAAEGFHEFTLSHSFNGEFQAAPHQVEHVDPLPQLAVFLPFRSVRLASAGRHSH